MLMERQLYHVLAEYNLLQRHHPSGIFVTPAWTNPLKWYGFVSVRSGYYVGGIFSLTMILPSDFPSHTLPRVFLSPTFFHPFVYPETGELSLQSAFSQPWDLDHNRIWHLFQHVRCLLTSPTASIRQHSAEQIHLLTRSSTAKQDKPIRGACMNYPNPEAADLIVNRKDQFEAQARDCVKRLSIWASNGTIAQPSSSSTVVNDVLSIQGWDDEAFLKSARLALQTHAENKCQPYQHLPVRGYSWIDPSNMSIFSARSSDSDNEES